MPRTMQASFVAGELSPALHARTDLDQYLRGVGLARNMFVKVFGGLANRPGSRFLDYTQGDQPARLVPFKFDDEQQYALEFTPYRMRFFVGPGQLIVQPVAAVLSPLIGAPAGQWNDVSTGTGDVGFPSGGAPGLSQISLIGAASSITAGEQRVTTGSVGAEHVVQMFVSEAVSIRVGSSSGADDVLADRLLGRGWHSVEFTPVASPFYLRFLHEGDDTRDVQDIFIVNGNGSTPTPLALFSPYGGEVLSSLTWTQKADVLTLCHPAHVPYDLKRYGALSWSIEVRLFAPALEAPASADVSSSVVGTPATDYYYQVTYQADSGEESLPCPFKTVTGAATLTAVNHVRITLVQPYPAGVRRALVYKFRGGVFGFMGQLPEGQPNFDDDGTILPKIDQTPPGDRNPFGEVDSYPAALAYWEQRLAMAGTNAAPDTVEMSRPGAFFNFGRSSPTRDDDSITFTPAGNLVRRIKHLVGAKALYLFTDSAVLAARRGDSGVTPAMEGGVAIELAKGATNVPPVQAGESVLFVTNGGRSLYLIGDRQSTEGFVGQELSLLSEHLLNESLVVDMAWCEVPHSLLWLIRADGKMVSLSFLDRQQVFGWGRHDTAGRWEACCAARADGIDYLYTVVRRRLGGQWRRCVERSALRDDPDIKNAFFVDCGLSLDVPVEITDVDASVGVVLTAPGHGLSVGDFVDVDGTGISQLDGRRYKVFAVDADNFRLSNQFTNGAIDATGWDGWLEGGVIRKALVTISGLDHLEGQTVAILADGSEHPSRTVTSGTITLQKAGARVHAGIPYSSDVETLNIPEQPEGYGRRKRVQQVQAYFLETRGVMVGPSFAAGDLTEAKWRSTEKWGEPTRARTGLMEIAVTPEWGLGGKVCFRQSLPLPFELLAALPVFERSSG
jgi:hypothetical protein